MPFRKPYIIHARDHRLVAADRTLIMGIINATPDSFSGDGIFARTRNSQSALRLGLRKARQGADILDIGGESTRPGAERISTREEIRRVVPLIRALIPKLTIPVSIDTYKPDVAWAALDAGASIVNIIQGTPADRKLLKIIQSYQAGVVLMHMRGVPKTMQSKVSYKDLLGEICSELKKSVEKCIETGIKKESIIVDPGIGFPKTAEQSLSIIRNLSIFHTLNVPLLVGPSRKSFIGKVLDIPVGKRLVPTLAAGSLCAAGGAHILRVHDVFEMKQALGLADAILTAP